MADVTWYSCQLKEDEVDREGISDIIQCHRSLTQTFCVATGFNKDCDNFMAGVHICSPVSLSDLVNPVLWAVPVGAGKDPCTTLYISTILPRARLKFADCQATILPYS